MRRTNATLAIPIGVLILLAIVGIIAVIVILSNQSNTVNPSPPTLQPTSTAIPTESPPPPTVGPNSCQCASNAQPLYNTFPHPAHTDASFMVMNFYNANGVAEGGVNLTVWVTVTVTADSRMQAEDPRFQTAFTYVYVDAHQMARGDAISFVFPKGVTANGRLGGGRIYIYYENPALFDTLRNTKYQGAYPTQSINTITPISDPNGQPATPSNQFSQLLEFTLDVDPGTDANTKAFIDYDLSAVDQIALPVYIFGGYDPRTLNDSLSGPNNHGFPCGKAYIGCTQAHQTTDGCPTQVVDRTQHGSICYASYKFCVDPVRDAPSFNETLWLTYCHKFDSVANGFGINQSLLDLYHQCILNNDLQPPCPPVTPPDISTPTAVIYGCNGEFLLENHCLPGIFPYTRSHLDGPQCSALNRGLCFQPNFTHVPLPDGLSCARFKCPGQVDDVSCMIHCYDYSCFGFTCVEYAQQPQTITDTCDGVTCTFNTATNCINNTLPVSKSKTSTCNDSTPDPYMHGLTQNDYAAWARSKGQRFYSFSLDEEEGGGNQQCLYSTQLDIVIFPACNGTF
jgi:hypothetical protein